MFNDAEFDFDARYFDAGAHMDFDTDADIDAVSLPAPC
jgi:hypothetical protein